MAVWPLTKAARERLWREFLERLERLRHQGKRPPIRRRWHSRWH
jgi:hypothetical protein